MHREALVERNRLLAEAYHAQPMRHRVRTRLLRLAAAFPFAPHTSHTQRILVIRPDHIGDMLLATPALHALKQAHPHSEIHVLAGPWAAPVLENFSDIAQVLTIRFPGFDRAAEKQRPWQPYQQILHVSRQLRAIGYSSAVILRPDHWWGALLAQAAGIRERIGYDSMDTGLFLTRKIPFRADHAVRQNLRLMESWTGHLEDSAIHFDLPVHSHDAEVVDEWLAAHSLSEQRRLIAIHAGAGTWVKQWDTLRWAQTADALHEHSDAQVIFTGGATESTMIGQIMQQSRHAHISAAGIFPLSQLAALYQRMQVVIGCDSGPLHIAAAVHTPTVTLFGPANPAEFAPWGDRHKHLLLMSSIACRPCRVLDWGDDARDYHPCVRDISVTDVLAAVRRLLSP